MESQVTLEEQLLLTYQNGDSDQFFVRTNSYHFLNHPNSKADVVTHQPIANEIFQLLFLTRNFLILWINFKDKLE